MTTYQTLYIEHRLSYNARLTSARVTRGGNVTSAGWQVTLCEPVAGKASGELLYSVYLLNFLDTTTAMTRSAAARLTRNQRR